LKPLLEVRHHEEEDTEKNVQHHWKVSVLDCGRMGEARTDGDEYPENLVEL
jgi:hypothetical protein